MSEPTPTEVIASWIPHDARWHQQARAAARTGCSELRSYITGLVEHLTDNDTMLSDEYDIRTIHAVRADLCPGSLAAVQWRRVQAALLPTPWPH